MGRLLLLWMVLWSAGARAEEAETYRGVLGAGVGGSGQRQDGVGVLGVNGSLGVTVWPGRPLRDDGEPRSIQAFLQRPHDLGVSVGGGYASAVRDATATSSAVRTETTTAFVSAGGGGWIGPVYLGAGILGERVAQTTGAVPSQAGTAAPKASYELLLLEPSAQINVAVRPRYHLGARYRHRLRYQDGSQLPATWGSVEVWLRFLLESRRAYFAVRLYTLDGDGWGGALYVEGFVTPRVGLFGGTQTDNGLIYVDSASRYLRVSVTTGANLWLSRRIELVPSLTVTSTGLLDTPMAIRGGQDFTFQLLPSVWSAAIHLGLNWRY